MKLFDRSKMCVRGRLGDFVVVSAAIACLLSSKLPQPLRMENDVISQSA
jgi:hypothetical protein